MPHGNILSDDDESLHFKFTELKMNFQNLFALFATEDKIKGDIKIS